ncbi:MAG TPA: peptide chain release factor N(5)-glutamine methyltransferase [Chlamydiales bacterium]|nr:peptide chain release factor N(5)-glutamine methyltransferase [Chlamydiales bacterium]
MKSVAEILPLSTQYLQERNIPNARRLVEELLGHLFKCKRIQVYMQFDRPIVEAELVTLRDWLRRLAKHEPLEYIIGEVEFFGGVFHTDSRALIPRPETELLVEMIAKSMKDQESLWDICTGTGCIGISLKRKFPNLFVSLSDLSMDALSLAKENALGLHVEFCYGDLFAPFEGRKADMIVCNPPYVTAKEFLTLDASVRDYEPTMALVGGESGLEFYERLAQEAPSYLNPKGQLILEIGASQGKKIFEIFSKPVWSRKELVQDLASKDRFFFLEIQ